MADYAGMFLLEVKMLKLLQKSWRYVIPVDIRTKISLVRFVLSGGKVILNPKFADDGLITAHVCDFMRDKKFLEAYTFGKLGGALKCHPGDIEFRAYINCWAASYALKLGGDFVECGVGKALFSRTIVKYLNFSSINKNYFLLDTFQGIPLSQSSKLSEQENMKYLNDVHFNENYYQNVVNAFREYKNVFIIPGRIPESFANVDIRSIAYLSIDMNNAAGEIAAINYLWDKVVPGGVIILDDYAYGCEFINQKEAWDKFAIEHGFSILTLPTGQGMIIKTLN